MVSREASELSWAPGVWPKKFNMDVNGESVDFIRLDPILIEQPYESPELAGYKYISMNGDVHLTVYND